MTKPTDVDGYLAALPEETRTTLESLRRAIKALAPSAVESISYGMPAVKYRGRPLAYFGAWKTHCALYGVNLSEHEKELVAYDTSKGALRFPPEKPLPDDLVKRLIGARIAEIDSATTACRPGGMPGAGASP